MWRQLGRKTPLLAALLLAACVGSDVDEGEVGFIEGFFGGIIVDEPRAALIGRDVLSAGGSAADAAVAAYFTLAVTLPGSASLGGGGVCLVHERTTSRVEVIEFLARAPARGGINATVAVPANIRGMALLQTRYGRLNWADLLIPAENFARAGHPISRAFVRDMRSAAATLRGDPEARRIFALDDAEVEEGRVIRQLELSTVISAIRTRGAGEFYGGPLGRQFVEAVQQTGATMTVSDLREFRPQILQPLTREFGDDLIYFPPPPAAGGVITAQLWAAGYDGDLYDDGDRGQRLHLLAELATRANGQLVDGTAGEPLATSTIANLTHGHDRQRHEPVEGSAPLIVDYSARGLHDGASIVAADLRGQAVACSFSLNRPFGVDKVAPGTGILLAAPEPGGRASLPSAVMVANPNTDQIFFGAAISGASPAVLAAVALETLDADRNLSAAVAEPRAYNSGFPDVMITESGVAEPVQKFIEQAGYRIQQQDSLGRVNGFHCPEGLPREPVCQFVADPRGHGLAVFAEDQ